MKGKYRILKRYLNLARLRNKMDKATLEGTGVPNFIKMAKIEARYYTLSNNIEKNAIMAYLYNKITSGSTIKCGTIREICDVENLDKVCWLETEKSVFDLINSIQYEKSYFYRNFIVTDVRDVTDELKVFGDSYHIYQATFDDHLENGIYRNILEANYDQIRNLTVCNGDGDAIKKLDNYYKSVNFEKYDVIKSLHLIK